MAKVSKVTRTPDGVKVTSIGGARRPRRGRMVCPVFRGSRR